MAAELTDEKKDEAATVAVTMEEVKEDVDVVDKGTAPAESGDDPLTRGIDIHNRDPNNMNSFIKIRFQEVIAEPDPEVFSFDKVYELSFKAFTATKLWSYRIISVILALPLAVCWGFYFACIAFCNAWICIPCLRSNEINCTCIRKLWQLFINTCVSPCFDAYARCFNSIRIRIVKE